MAVTTLCLYLFALAYLADAISLNRGASLNHRRRSERLLSKEVLKPEPLLSFQASVQAASGTTQDVIADAERLLMVVDDLSPSFHSMSDTWKSNLPHDGSVLDFNNTRQIERQRFFNETVCTITDMQVFDPRAQQSLLEDRAAYLNKFFRMAVGQVLGAPLDLYDMAINFEGELVHQGRSCFAWADRQVSKIDLSDFGGLPDLELAKLGVNTRNTESLLLAVQDSLDAGLSGNVTWATNATFCVAETGEVLATSLSSLMTLKQNISNITQEAVLWQNDDQTNVTFKKNAALSSLVLNAAHGAAGGRCLDLTHGTVGPSELKAPLNKAERLARINSEANGHWEADAYEMWEGTTVEQIVPGLGAELGPLKLPLRHQVHSHFHVPHHSFFSTSAASSDIPSKFDPREQWPDCPLIGISRNQGPCGSCWAFAAVSVLSDRFCIASHSSPDKASLLEATVNATNAHMLQTLHLAPEHLIDCDEDNNGCGGGRLDNVWWYLRDHGVPTETCRPYTHCPLESDTKCHYGKSAAEKPSSPLVAGAAFASKEVASSSKKKCFSGCSGSTSSIPMPVYRVSIAYAVSEPSDIAGLQRELLTHGPVEVGFYVFSDFHSYRRGVYHRTRGAYGPLGGHAVKMLGWGKAGGWRRLEYWLVANSWSPKWGLGGLFKIRRGTNECGIESTPAAGLPMLGESFPSFGGFN